MKRNVIVRQFSVFGIVYRAIANQMAALLMPPEERPPGFVVFIPERHDVYFVPIAIEGGVVGEGAICAPRLRDMSKEAIEAQRVGMFGVFRFDDYQAWKALEPGFPGNVSVTLRPYDGRPIEAGPT